MEKVSGWRRSSFCAHSNCVEVTVSSDGWVVVRGNEEGVRLRFTPDEWRAFAAGVRAGEFDLV